MLLSDSDDFENLHDAMNEALNSNIQEVRDSDVSPIHKNIHCYYNSVNAFVGPQGTGKTYSAMDEILKIMLASPKTHLLIYISEFGEETRDPTIEKLKHLRNQIQGLEMLRKIDSNLLTEQQNKFLEDGIPHVVMELEL